MDNCFSRDSFIGLDGIFLISLAEVDAVERGFGCRCRLGCGGVRTLRLGGARCAPYVVGKVRTAHARFGWCAL